MTDALDALRLEVVALRVRVAALEARPDLEAAIASAVPAGVVFGARELHAHAALHPELAAALHGLSPKRIGRRLQKMRAIVRVGRDAAGTLWMVQ